MILERLEVDDFLKFARVRLSELPASGLIGIRGPNEAGKTSLGEALTFALFGRTLRLPPARRAEGIRWGASGARVELQFRTGSGEQLVVQREMDHSGGYDATLRHPDADEPLAKGPQRVDRALEERLGFDFESFRYAFFLGQKEVDLLLRSPGSGEALSRMIGLGSLDRARERAEEEASALEEKAREVSLYLRLQQELFQRFQQDAAGCVAAEREARDSRDLLATRADRLVNLEEELGRRQRLGEGAEKLQVLLDRVLLAASLKSLSGRVAILEAEARSREEQAHQRREASEDAQALRQEHRMFSESLAELEELLRTQAREAGGEGGVREGSRFWKLKTRIRDLEERLQGDAHLADQLTGRATRSRRGLGAAALAGCGVAAVTANPLGLLALPFAGAAYLAVPAISARGDDARSRLERMQTQLEEARAEFAELQRSVELCERISVRDRDALVEGIMQLGSEPLERLVARIEARHPRFWSAPETFLEGYGEVLDDGAELRKQDADTAAEEARRAASRVESLRGRLDALARASRLPRLDFTPFEGLGAEEAAEGLDDDLVTAERLAYRVDAAGVGGRELGRDRDSLTELLLGFDPERTRPWPDLEGFFRVLRGVEPPGHGRGDDPLPWARKQEERARAFLEVPPREEDADLAREVEELRREVLKLTARAELLEARSSEQGGDEADVEAKEDAIAELELELEELESQAAIRRELAEGLSATGQRMRARLLPAVSEYAASLLPRITGGRHGRARLDEDGELQVFAPQAGEFVPLDALSGGARDQFLLALRLAFASAVIRSRMPEDASQFLFLDEPLASSDEARGLAFLGLLEDRSDSFRQVFVVTHRLAGDENYDLILRLPEEGDTLIHPASQEPRLAEAV